MSEIKESVKKEKRRFGKNIIIGVLVFVILLLVGYIVYTDVINPSETKEDNVVEKEDEDSGATDNSGSSADCVSGEDYVVEKTIISGDSISSDIQAQLFNIAGIKVDDYDHDVSRLAIFYNVSGEVNKFSSYDKEEIIWDYARNNELTTHISGDEYESCAAGSGQCLAISVDNYNIIAKKYGITDNGDDLFTENGRLKKYKDYYLYTNGGYAVSNYLTWEEISFKHYDDYIEMTAKAIKRSICTNEIIETKEVWYKFYKNDDGYYLYSVGNRAL